MLYVLLPLRSKRVSRNWEHTCEFLNRTLQNLSKQTDPRVSAVLVCHEAPDVPVPGNLDLVTVPTDFPVPRSSSEMMEDKCAKTARGVHEIFRLIQPGGLNFMTIVDPDDLLHVDLAKFIHAHPDECGWYIEDGYMHRFGGHLVIRNDKFDRICGSSTIIRIDDAMLRHARGPDYLAELLNRGHHVRREVMEEEGRSLARLPFFGAVYTIATGDNWSGDISGWKGIRKFLRALPRYRVVTAGMRELFPGL